MLLLTKTVFLKKMHKYIQISILQVSLSKNIVAVSGVAGKPLSTWNPTYSDLFLSLLS